VGYYLPGSFFTIEVATEYSRGADGKSTEAHEHGGHDDSLERQGRDKKEEKNRWIRWIKQGPQVS